MAFALKTGFAQEFVRKLPTVQASRTTRFWPHIPNPVRVSDTTITRQKCSGNYLGLLVRAPVRMLKDICGLFTFSSAILALFMPVGHSHRHLNKACLLDSANLRCTRVDAYPGRFSAFCLYGAL